MITNSAAPKPTAPSARAAAAAGARHPMVDAETGLRNAAALRGEMDRMAVRAERHGFPLGMVTLRFPEGCDELFVELARHLGAWVRGADVLARTGPRELRLLLSHEDAVHAPRVVERLRALCTEFAADRPGQCLDPDVAVEFDAAGFSHLLGDG
jgi:GGDEF domain-containing protein